MAEVDCELRSSMMEKARLPRRLSIQRFALVALAMAAFSGAGALFVARQPAPATAQAGSCGTSHDGLSGEEAQFVDLLEDWRADRQLQAPTLEVSGPLNAAAAWFAEHLVVMGPAGLNGHVDHEGRNWVQRAIDCGYDETFVDLFGMNRYYAHGSGEGVGYFSSNAIDPESYGPAEGLEMVDYNGSGIYISAGGSLPAKCVGVGVYRDGDTVAWIVVIAQWEASLECPEPLSIDEDPSPSATASASPSASVSPSATPSPTRTATPSPTPTRTPTPTPTPTATPIPEWNNFAPNVVSNP